MKLRILTIVVIALLGVIVAASFFVVYSYGGASASDSKSYFSFTCCTGGGSSGVIKSTGGASGFGYLEAVSKSGLYSIQWSYASGAWSPKTGYCPNTDTLHGTVVAITGPSPVALKAKITVVITAAPLSPTMKVSSGAFSYTLTAPDSTDSLMGCPI
jgi:hypothetical protein